MILSLWLGSLVCVLLGYTPICTVGLTGDEICDYVDNYLGCDNSPCDCGESDLNCMNCQTNQGCAQCSSGYFRRDSDSKCVECALIDDCSHCTDNTGCQQCDSNDCTYRTTECGIRVCECGEQATPAPVTPAPVTPAPISLGDQIEGLRGAFDDFWRDDDSLILDEMRNYYTNDAQICWGGFECSTLDEFFDNFAGLCDGGSISLFDDLVFQDLRVIYSFYRACINENNDFGLFWINGVGITKYTSDGMVQEMTVNWRNYDDLIPILEEYSSPAP